MSDYLVEIVVEKVVKLIYAIDGDSLSLVNDVYKSMEDYNGFM
jgi:hypothetical protein